MSANSVTENPIDKPSPNHSHSSEAVWRKNPVASGSSGGWEQKIPPLVETNSVRAYAGKTSQFTAVQRSSCRDFRTHRISLKLGISSKVKQILILPIFVVRDRLTPS